MMRPIRRRMAGIDKGEALLVAALLAFLLGSWCLAERWDEIARDRDLVHAQRVQLTQHRARLQADARRAGWVCGYAHGRGLADAAAALCEPVQVAP